MKNENIPDIEQGLHERLCSYVFGELTGDERAAFERELARSSELRAERERLTATIGLVKRAIPDEGLSPMVRGDLLASARRSRFRFLKGRRLVTLAAALVALVGGALALRQMGGMSELQRQDVKVARAPAPEKLVERQLPSELAARANGRGVKEEKAAAESVDRLRDLAYVGDGAGSPPAATPVPVQRELEALGYGAGGDDGVQMDTAIIDRLSMPYDVRNVPGASGPTSPGAQASGVYLAKANGGEAAAEEAVGGTSVAAGQDNFATGTPTVHTWRATNGGNASRTGAQATEPAAVEPTELGILSQGGAYRGPGDSVPPGGRTNETRLGREAAVLHGIVPPPPEVVERLEALGYAGAQESNEQALLDRAAGFVAFETGSRREPIQTREQVAAQVEELLGACRVAPGETPRDMFFRYWGDSPFVPSSEERTSTFAVDVDTASYTLARAYLNNGELPPREAVRTEEFVNYFKADQPPPSDGKPFAIGLELAPSLFASDARTEMLRVTVRGKDVADFERQPVALTFVIDNSGSMEEGGRLELVKRALGLLLRQLYSGDSVAVVKFSNHAAVVTPPLAATRRGELESLIHALPIEGGTNVEAGLRQGYELARENLARNAVNRIVLCSDGVGNIGETSAKGLLAIVEDAREQGIYLNTVGVGMGNHNDAFLEELADKGDGVCNYVDSDAEAKRVFVDGLASALQPIARDVKIQVEFDPAQVESWRLLGYENRALRTKDFRDDRIDAGEVNAGHQVSALYELVRRPSRNGPLATVRLRYKPPFAIDAGREGERARAEAEQALEIERTLAASDALSGFASATNGYQRAVLVAELAETLRQSVHARGDSFARLLEESRRLEKALGDPDFTEFVALLGKANPLLDQLSKQETPRLQQLLDELSRLHYEDAQRERKRELAAQAGEPERPLDEQQADERAALELREAIQQREAEVRAELERLHGVAPAQPSPQELEALRGLGYAGDKNGKQK